MTSRDPDPHALWEADNAWRTEPFTALPTLRALAENGSAWSALLLGCSFEAGIGTDPDSAQAEQWYRRAAEGGCQQAQLRLGRIYEERQDFTACEEVYEMGRAANWAPAMSRLAWTKLRQTRTPARLQEARTLYQQAITQGDLAAHMDFAQLLMRGRFGWRLIPRGLRVAWSAAFKFVALQNAIDLSAPSPSSMN